MPKPKQEPARITDIIRVPDYLAAAPRKFFTKFREVLETPNLVEIQTDSYRWFFEVGLKQLLAEINPIVDYPSGKHYDLSFHDYYLDKPKYDVPECRQRGSRHAFRIQMLGQRTGNFTLELHQHGRERHHVGRISLVSCIPLAGFL